MASPPLTYKGIDLYSNIPCAFCSKSDIFKNMQEVETEPDTFIYLCNWCAHFMSKAERDEYTYWLLNQLIGKCLNWEIDQSYYNGIVG